MSDFRSRKAARIVQFERLRGVKLVTCTACGGSGYYDNTGSPPCGSCDGTGKMRDKLNKLPGDPVPEPYTWRDKLRRTQQIKATRKAIKTGRK